MSNPVMLPVAEPQAPANDLGAAPNPIPGASPADPTVGLMNHMSGIHNQAVAKYEKIKEALDRAGLIRSELDRLVKMGDMVTQQEVTKGATKLVAAGMGAPEVAGLLSEMPPNGEALQGWLSAHDMQLRQNEAQLKQLAATTRHDLGVGALRLAAAHSMMNPAPGGPGPQTIDQAPPTDAGASQAPGDTDGAVNSLMPGGPSNG